MGRLLAINFAGSDIEDEPLPVVTISSGIESVQAKENNRRCHRCALVPVKKWMIAAKVKKVSRSDVDEINVRRLSPEARLRCKHCRRQERLIADSVQTAKDFYRFVMNFPNNFDG